MLGAKPQKTLKAFCGSLYKPTLGLVFNLLLKDLLSGQVVLFVLVAGLTGNDHIFFGTHSPSHNWNSMIHCQLRGGEWLLAIVAELSP